MWFWTEVFSKYLLFVDNLVEETNNIQNKQECQTMEYDIQFICCSYKINEIEKKHIMRKRRKKHLYNSMEPVAKKKISRRHKKKIFNNGGYKEEKNTFSTQSEVSESQIG